MAYATPIGAQCSEDGCDRPATYVVQNGRNEVVRECCRRHARLLVDRLSDEEARRAWTA